MGSEPPPIEELMGSREARPREARRRRLDGSDIATLVQFAIVVLGGAFLVALIVKG